jgi:hypothetical protein
MIKYNLQFCLFYFKIFSVLCIFLEHISVNIYIHITLHVYVYLFY